MTRFTGILLCAVFLLISFASCQRKEYTCYCLITDQGYPQEEKSSLGLLSNNKAQKKCNDYQETRTNEFRGTTKQIRCKVIND